MYYLISGTAKIIDVSAIVEIRKNNESILIDSINKYYKRSRYGVRLSGNYGYMVKDTIRKVNVSKRERR